MEILPGVDQIRLPLPFSLRWVNLYLLKGRDGYTMIDAGLGTDEAYQVLQSELQQMRLDAKDIRRIVVTHFHHDHYGLVGRLVALSGAEVIMHRDDYGMLGRSGEEWQQSAEATVQFLSAHGMPADELQSVKSMMSFPGRYMEAIPGTKLVDDGEEIDIDSGRLRVIWTPGHSIGHICLLDEAERVLFSGDHLLAKITPHVGLEWDSRGNPLGEYLRSLDKVARLGADLALPAHGPLVKNVAARAATIQRHHEFRMKVMLDAIGNRERNAYQVCLDVFGQDRPVFEKRLALSETLAHLELMVIDGKLERITKEKTIGYRSTQV